MSQEQARRAEDLRVETAARMEDLKARPHIPQIAARNAPFCAILVAIPPLHSLCYIRCVRDQVRTGN